VLFPAEVYEGIADGSVTVAFRWWKRPGAKVGGTQITPGGVIGFDAVDEIASTEVTEADARAAGAADVAAVLSWASDDADRRLYRIRFHRVGDDPRIALRDQALDDAEREDIAARLARLDARSPDGPWTGTVLDLIDRNPAVVSHHLMAETSMDDLVVFKRRVRRLKELGLTESLGTGYRLSPRGESFLRRT
jgi:hypothetical protein